MVPGGPGGLGGGPGWGPGGGPDWGPGGPRGPGGGPGWGPGGPGWGPGPGFSPVGFLGGFVTGVCNMISACLSCLCCCWLLPDCLGGPSGFVPPGGPPAPPY